MIPDQKKIAECYQPLFDLMANDHGITLTASQMDDIINCVETVNENITEAWRSVCDVVGCNETASSQGFHWDDSGYWCICYKHGQDAKDGKHAPEIKPEAIARENGRGADGNLP